MGRSRGNKRNVIKSISAMLAAIMLTGVMGNTAYASDIQNDGFSWTVAEEQAYEHGEEPMLRLRRPEWSRSRAWGWFMAVLSIALAVVSIVYWLRGGNPLVAWLIAFTSPGYYFSDPLIEKLEDEAKRRQQAGKDIPPEEPQP